MEIDVRRAVISSVLGFAAYLVALVVLGAILGQEQATPGGMMMGGTTKNGNFQLKLVTISISSLFVGVGAALVSYHFLPAMAEKPSVKPAVTFAVKDAMWDLLSEDEKLVMNEVVKSEGVTQDSLVYRLNFSKAKVSLLLSSLEEKGLVFREKLGRTYSIRLSDKMKAMISKSE